MAVTVVPLERRRELVSTPGITLDGARAVIGGVRNPFARVTRLSDGLSAEWAWSTVDRIVTTKEGRFTT